MTAVFVVTESPVFQDGTNVLGVFATPEAAMRAYAEDNRRRKLILNGYATRWRRKHNTPSARDRHDPTCLPLGHLVKGWRQGGNRRAPRH